MTTGFTPTGLLQAAAAGVTSGTVGAIVSINPLCVVLTSPIFGYYVSFGFKLKILTMVKPLNSLAASSDWGEIRPSCGDVPPWRKLHPVCVCDSALPCTLS